jgi:hypothetical protein
MEHKPRPYPVGDLNTVRSAKFNELVGQAPDM